MHGLHATGLQPGFCSIKKQVCGILAVDAFKKTASAGGLIKCISLFIIDESSNPAYQTAFCR